MSHIDIGKAPPGTAVLPFYFTGALAFFILCLLMFLSAESLTAHYFNPHLLTMVHTAAIGWGTMVIFGAAHQLLPVICERDLYSPSAAGFSWYTLATGAALLGFSFWNFTTGWLMILGGSLVVCSSLLYCVNVFFTTRICKKYSVQKLFLISSAVWLLFTTTVGLLLAINLSNSFFEKNHLDILKLHAHAGLAGWFLQLIAGVSSKLVPMFLLGKSGKEKLLIYAFVLQNAGLSAFLLDGYFSASSARFMVYALIVLAGIACWMAYLADTYKNRIKKKTDIQMKHTFISMLCLLAAVLLIPVIHFFKGNQWTILYGTLLFMGWITAIILGKTFKTLPFIVWNEHYKNLSGKVKVPLPKHLYNEKLVAIQFRLFIAALLSLAAGIVFNHIFVIRCSLAIWIAVSVLYLYNVVKTLMHKTTTTDL
ncbi:cbb3-type cytochrome c oxidase subunit I [Haoranjiania flava]|uniref:Cbb3-type cytochrome c oxidase subunit I n=1 Tax=Haoranjiania flava TaxID=1856322 RepID=A0AAE3IPR1_9BACT|nr:cbb3-type cytochrome c oxidase subunit I [Haoranjiania flava]MCU7695075.1 cbb3-type cytochrome c oxidase subunit I [Haoranjiania flava]